MNQAEEGLRAMPDSGPYSKVYAWSRAKESGMSTMAIGWLAKRAGVNIEENLIASCPGRGELESCPIVAALAGRERLSESKP